MNVLLRVVERVRRQGVVGTLRYLANRSRLGREAAGAAKAVLTHNDFLFRELRVERDVVRQLSESIRVRIPVLLEDAHVRGTEAQSFHFMAFAALKASGFAPRNILEIGTFLGYTTNYLSQLFPDARVFTAALPPDDPVFGAYHRQEQAGVKSILDTRLSRPNITLLKMNSAFLWNAELPELDLIWLDGGHQYPVVAWDHFFSLSKLAPGGWLFSDDIRIPPPVDATSQAERFHAYRVVDYYNARMDDGFRFLLKREDVASYLHSPKYVAVYRKRT